MKSLFMSKMGDPRVKDSMGALDVLECPMPEPGPEDVLIKVAYASICGSDLHYLKGEIGDLYEKIKSELPRQIGHEISGTVEKVGAKAAAYGFKPGDKITGNFMQFCNSCHYCHDGQEIFCPNRISHHDAMSQYVCWHMSQIYKLPDNTDLLTACMTEPLSIALHAIEMAHLRLGSRVAIFGGGGIGLMCTQLAKMAGASTVTIIEPVASKRETALAMGADFVIDPLSEDVSARALEITNNLGFDSVLESSGASSAAQAAVQIIGYSSHVVYFSMYNPNFEMPMNLFKIFYQREAHLHGMVMSSDCFEKTIKILPRMDFSKIIQRIYPLEQHEQAFADMRSGQCPKVVFKCN